MESDYRNERETNPDKPHDGSLMIKAVLWFIALCIIGFIACVILGTLRIAIQAVVIVGAILMFIALLGWVAYEKIKDKIEGDKDTKKE